LSTIVFLFPANQPLNMNAELIIDAHLDLSMNAMEWNRDYRLSIREIREREKGMTDKPDRGKGTVCFPELRKGNIGLVVATQIARYVSPENPLPGWHSPEQAWAQTQGQLAWYRAMEKAGEIVQITDHISLENHLKGWHDGSNKNEKPVGYILSLEGADSLVTIENLQTAYRYGLRAVGPAHYGPGRYAPGTDAHGSLTSEGVALLREMDQLRMILDVTHLCDESFWEAIDLYQGPVWASHSNCRALVDHNRQFSDDQIKILIERDAVIGIALDSWMMVPSWVRGQSTPQNTGCNIEVMIDHMDHICQLAGHSLQVGIGSDLDGAFGKEQSPYDLETIADLQKIPGSLKKRGYSDENVKAVMNGNWLRFLRKNLP
jgi:membrane dipeptidase